MTSTNMDRRSFLKGAGMAGAAAMAAGTLGLSGCAPKGQGELSSTGEGELILDAEKFTNAKWNFENPPEPIDESDITETVDCDI